MTSWSLFVTTSLTIQLTTCATSKMTALLDSLTTLSVLKSWKCLCSFENVSLQGDPVKLAFDRLKSINHNCPVFDDCLVEVYEIFVQAAAAGKILLHILTNQKPVTY